MIKLYIALVIAILLIVSYIVYIIEVLKHSSFKTQTITSIIIFVLNVMHAIFARLTGESIILPILLIIFWGVIVFLYLWQLRKK